MDNKWLSRTLSAASELAWLICCTCGLLSASAFAQDGARNAIETNQTKWRSTGLAQYEYGYHKHCECYRDSPPETVVTVRDGVVIGVRHRPANSSNEVPAEQRNLQFYWTVR